MFSEFQFYFYENKGSNFFFRALDLDFLGSETRETAISVLDQDQAAHRYEDIPIAAEQRKSALKAEKLQSKSLDDITPESEIIEEQEDTNAKKVENEEKSKDSSVNYGYHPIIDFFGNFRFDTA